MNDILKTGDVLNQTLLELTALSDEDENKIGDELSEKIQKEIKAGKEKKFDVRKIWDSLLKHISRTKIKYSYMIVENNDVNAYAVAGGRVFINTGLLDLAESEDELAFVIAHEIAHNELKHCIKRVQYSAITSKINPTLAEIVQIAYSTYSIPFNKNEEFEADALGVRLSEKAGYSKQGALSFFTKLKELEKKYEIDKRNPLNDFISSHPTADERKKKIE